MIHYKEKSSQVMNYLRLARDISCEIGLGKTMLEINNVLDTYLREDIKRVDEIINEEDKKEEIKKLK
jgi:hypothetical protein